MTRILVAALATLIATAAMATDYNYMSAQEAQASLETISIIDIQVKEGFEKAHLEGAIQTNAYPVKSADDKAKLGQALETVKTTDAKVLIVCPRGKGGAKRTYDYLLEQGVGSERLFILEGGQEGWPY